MNLIRTTVPDALLSKDLLLLQEACNKHDHISLTFPLEEDCICCLLYENERLLSALITFFTDSDTMECYGCTLPGERQKGHFTSLLKELVNDYPDCDFIFPVYENCQDGLKTLQAMEATFCYKEHFMELSIPMSEKSIILKDSKDGGGLTISSSRHSDGPICYEFLKDDSVVGTCSLDTQENNAYLYGFEIPKALRGQGLGTACLRLFLKTYVSLPGDQRKNIIYLQVSDENLPAVSLYKKAGFHIRESLSYYLY
nr:GNAT family N-acetyltransferase [uncultured Clostridium sp.]